MLLCCRAVSADQLMPVDNSDAAYGFTEFKQKLIAAIMHRDAKFIDSIVAPSIAFSFGAESGAQAFKKEFKYDDPKSPFWTDLNKIVSLGGSYNVEQQIVWYPYLFDRWPDKYDGVEYGVAANGHASLLSQPGLSATPIAILDFDIVKILDAGPVWVKVRAPNGKVGYIERTEMHSPGWRRAGFQRINGKWLMTTYITGD